MYKLSTVCNQRSERLARTAGRQLVACKLFGHAVLGELKALQPREVRQCSHQWVQAGVTKRNAGEAQAL